MGFLNLLTLVFIGCKLTGFIAWSWFWVLSPSILHVGFALTVTGLIGLVAVFKGTK